MVAGLALCFLDRVTDDRSGELFEHGQYLVLAPVHVEHGALGAAEVVRQPIERRARGGGDERREAEPTHLGLEGGGFDDGFLHLLAGFAELLERRPDFRFGDGARKHDGSRVVHAREVGQLCKPAGGAREARQIFAQNEARRVEQIIIILGDRHVFAVEVLVGNVGSHGPAKPAP